MSITAGSGWYSDPDVGHGVLGDVAALGYHHGNRLADMANFAARQRYLGSLVNNGTLDGWWRH